MTVFDCRGSEIDGVLMKTILLLLTESFPFTKNSEAFLEPEIEIAASCFAEIYIVPTARVKKNSDKRDVTGQNVYVSPVKRKNLFLECLESIPFISSLAAKTRTIRKSWQLIRYWPGRWVWRQIS